ARARGLGGLRLWRGHVLPALFGPLVGGVAGMLRVLVGGLVIVEYVYNWNGLGDRMISIGQFTTNRAADVPIAAGAGILLVFFLCSPICWPAWPNAGAARIYGARATMVKYFSRRLHLRLGRINLLFLIGALMVATLFVLALFAPWLAPHAPDDVIIIRNGASLARAPTRPEPPKPCSAAIACAAIC
ncbi:MAG: ABC transporter permease subunit, partial [Oscillochloris sp.]|nr:ABC transporter permease subunit [Oscillochloris sp.]